MTIRLHDVDSTVSEYSGCRDVNFRWFVVDREEPVAFVAEAIEVFDLGNSTAGYPVEALSASSSRSRKRRCCATTSSAPTATRAS
jgi:hypothetical protein